MMTAHEYFALPSHPLPEIAPEWQPFFDGCRQNELLIEECMACGRRQFYPRGQCMLCGGAVRHAVADGIGKIYSYSVVRMSRDPVFGRCLPYVIGMIDIAGVRIPGAIVGDEAKLTIGAEVHAVFGELPGQAGIWAPVWELS